MPYTAAEIAAIRTAIGLSLDQFADALGVNPRTCRSWESGRDAVSSTAAGAITTLADEHTALVAAILDSETPVVITRDRATYTDKPRPRAWYLAAAGRALLADPDVEVDWR